jgi:zinc transporter ZupT
MPGVFAGGDQFVGLWILLGFFIQVFLEQLSGGVEHGHIHPAHHANTGFAVQVMIGLCLHAFMEGMPLENYEEFHNIMLGEGHNHSHNHLLYGVLLHKAPAAFVLVLLLRISGFKNVVVLICLFTFASMSPLGAGLTKWLESMNLLDIDMMKIIVAIVIGSFLHISTTILFEIENPGDHKISIKKMVVIAFGMLAALATIL